MHVFFFLVCLRIYKKKKKKKTQIFYCYYVYYIFICFSSIMEGMNLSFLKGCLVLIVFSLVAFRFKKLDQNEIRYYSLKS